MNLVMDIYYKNYGGDRYEHIDRFFIERYKNKKHLILIYNQYGMKKECRVPLNEIRLATLIDLNDSDHHEYFRYECDDWDDTFANNMGIHIDDYWFERGE